MASSGILFLALSLPLFDNFVKRQIDKDRWNALISKGSKISPISFTLDVVSVSFYLIKRSPILVRLGC